MSKKLAIMLCILISAAMVLGACAALPEAEDTATAGPAPDNNKAIVVADVNGEEINRNEYILMYNNLCSQYGIDPNDPQMGGIAQEMAIDTLVAERVMFAKIEELGFMALSDEEEEEARVTAQQQLDTYVSYNMSQIMEELGEDYTGDEFEAKLREFEADALEQIGMTKEDFIDYFRNQTGVEHAMEALVGDIQPSEDELKTQYDMKLAQDQEIITTPAAYEAATNSGETPYVVPEGLRSVRHVLIKLSDEAAGEVMQMRVNEPDAADALLDEKLAEVQAEADEVLGKLQAGEITFDEAIETYNDDPGMAANPEGYIIGEGYTSYVPTFTEGAMSLNNIGDITGLVKSDFGYHIIEYTKDIESGTVAFEDVKEEILAAAAPAMQERAWVELVDAWEQDMQVNIYYENL